MYPKVLATLKIKISSYRMKTVTMMMMKRFLWTWKRWKQHPKKQDKMKIFIQNTCR